MIVLKKQELLLVGLLTSLAFFLRFFSLSEALWSGDAVDFALGLRSYDLAKYQPHPPGYPLYMVFSKLLATISGDEAGSLRMTSVLFGAFTVLPLFYLAKQMYGKQVAILSAVLLLINPLHWLMSTRAMSDIMGLFFIVFCVYFLYRATDTREQTRKLQDLLWASCLLGLALGVRLSYFPHLFLWFFVVSKSANQSGSARDKMKMVALPMLTFLGTILLWGIAQAMFVGVDAFFSEIFHFGRGHLTEWGGTMWTHPDLISRLKELLVQDLIIHGLGGGAGLLRLVVGMFALASVFFYVFKEGFCFRVQFLICWLLPYLLWVFIGQNLNNPRHILAALPVLILVIARGALYFSQAFANALSPGLFRRNVFGPPFLSSRKLCYACPAILVVSLSLTSLKLAMANREAQSSSVQLVDYVKRRYDPAKTIIFCRETRRLFDYYAPNYITVNEKKVDIEGAVAFHAYGQPEVILLTSDLLKQWRLEDKEGSAKLHFSLVDRFQHDPYLQNAGHQIELYRLEV